MISLIKNIVALLVANLISVGLIQAQTSKAYYTEAYNNISSMLSGSSEFDFKKAVYYTENAYFEDLQDEVLGDTRLDMSDFKARFMDSRIPRFTSMDPLCEKYYWISPYAYAANNPIKFVDPDGKEIWIATQTVIRNGSLKVTESVKYSEGKLYNKDGSLYEGKNEFALKVQSALVGVSKINDSYVQEVLSTLETSENKHIAIPNSEGRDQVMSRDNSLTHKGVGVGSILKLTLNENDKTDGLPSTPIVTMSHELKHSYDIDQGFQKEMVTGEAPSAKDPKEISAVNFENRVRYQLKMPLRKTYYTPIDKKLLEDPSKHKTDKK